MATSYKNKVIQVQKPAQSLQAFQKKVASGEDIKVGYLKPMLMTAGALVVVFMAFFAFRAMRASAVEKHEVALADLQLEVAGDGITPVPAAEVEKRMREKLPRLEALAKSAPGSQQDVTEGLLATWRLELEGKGAVAPAQTDVWGKLRLAQRQVALGQAQEALGTLTPLRGSATPGKAWANLYWATLLDADRLQGDRTKAWQDFADYKARFKDQADAGMERILAGV
jgi:hypothetical protein